MVFNKKILKIILHRSILMDWNNNLEKKSKWKK